MFKKGLSEKGQGLVASAIIFSAALAVVFIVLILTGLMANPFAKKPTTASNPQTPGYAGDQANPTCVPASGYRTCATAEVVYAVYGEGTNVDAHLQFAWNANGNEANALGSAQIYLQKSDGSTTVTVTTGDNVLPFDHAYVPLSVIAPGFTCYQRDSKTWDCQ